MKTTTKLIISYLVGFLFLKFYICIKTDILGKEVFALLQQSVPICDFAYSCTPLVTEKN